MDCLCTNSLKLNILTFLDKKQIFCYENDLINKFYEETKDKIKMKKNFENLDENFIKGHIKSVIKEMIYNDKIIQEKVFEKNDNNNYYYMNLNNNLIQKAFSDKKNIEKEIINSDYKKEEKNDKSNNKINKIKNEKIKKINELKIEIEKMKKEKQKKRCKLLHKYNDLKDIAQEILGRIAIKKNITVKELYEEYDINENDDEEISERDEI